MPDIILILSLLDCWLFDDFALVLGLWSKKDKNNRVKFNFLEKSNFLPLLC